VENSRTHARIDDQTRLVDSRTNDLRNKSLALEDNERELGRNNGVNAKLNTENVNLGRSNEVTAAENYDIRKGVDHQNGKNADMAVQIRDTEVALKDRENAIFVTRRDLDGQRVLSQTNHANNEDHLSELHQMENHSRVLDH